MADRVAEIPEEAVKAVARDLYMLDPDQDPDETEIGEAVRVIGHVLSALPSEWLLARALSEVQLKDALRRLTEDGYHLEGNGMGGFSEACSACHTARSLRAALSVLEQEAGGER